MTTHHNDNERMQTEASLHLAAEIHKQVRRDLKAQRIIRPGAKLVDIADFIEAATKRHASDVMISDPSITTINGGIGFPVGLSINSCAAHYHPYLNDATVLSKNDIIKVDFGTEINGWIIDSAFTEYGFGENNHLSKELSDTFGNLTACMRDATNTGIKNIGIDAPIVEWSQAIEEVMRSYDICPISNLGGHNILHEIIHGNVFLPACASSVRDTSERFGAGVYAIETFGSTEPTKSSSSSSSSSTTIEVVEKGESAIFRLNPGFMRYTAAQLSTQFHSPIFKIHSVQKLFSQIKSRFKTLPFADRYVRSSASAERTPLALLAKHEVLYSYPPLCTAAAGGSGYTAQFEHTVMLKETGGPPIVFSRDDDY
jgi:methionyl aminopeptidase